MAVSTAGASATVHADAEPVCETTYPVLTASVDAERLERRERSSSPPSSLGLAVQDHIRDSGHESGTVHRTGGAATHQVRLAVLRPGELVSAVQRFLNLTTRGVAGDKRTHPVSRGTLVDPVEVLDTDTTGSRLVKDVLALVYDARGFILPTVTGITTRSEPGQKRNIRKLRNFKESSYSVPRLENTVVNNFIDDKVNRNRDYLLDSIPDVADELNGCLEGILQEVETLFHSVPSGRNDVIPNPLDASSKRVPYRLDNFVPSPFENISKDVQFSFESLEHRTKDIIPSPGQRTGKRVPNGFDYLVPNPLDDLANVFEGSPKSFENRLDYVVPVAGNRRAKEVPDRFYYVIPGPLNRGANSLERCSDSGEGRFKDRVPDPQCGGLDPVPDLFPNLPSKLCLGEEQNK